MNIRLSVFLFTIIVLFSYYSASAQTDKEDTSVDNTEDLEKIIEKESMHTPKPSDHYVSATFKSTRIIDGQSIENVGKGVLDFRISHRFGELNQGIKNLYGLDNATTKFSFDYGIFNWLMVGVGRSSFEKEYDGYIKVKIIHQRTDDIIPVSVSFYSAISVQTMDVINIPGYTYYFSNRLFFANQLLVARKFNNLFSLQLMPTYLHYNLVDNASQPNEVFAVGVGGRIKISKRIAITGEYYYNISGYKLSGYNNPVSIGIDIETGGHVFQLFLTNSPNLTERSFIGETIGDITKGAIHLGFNISRVFTVVRTAESKNLGNKVW